MSAVEGATSVPAGQTSPAALRARLGQAAPRFRAVIVDRVAAGASEGTFLDATCQPPQTFTLGGVLAHVLTFAAVRRTWRSVRWSHQASMISEPAIRCISSEEGSDASGITRNFE